MNNLLPFSQAANYTSSPKKLSLVASGTAALNTHFCQIPFGLAINCPFSQCFLEGLPKNHDNYICQLLSVDTASLENSQGFLKPPQE